MQRTFNCVSSVWLNQTNWVRPFAATIAATLFLAGPRLASAQTYTLTVTNGSGTGHYSAGQTVAIKANTPTTGYIFTNWTGQAVQSATSASTTLTMPAANASVTANVSLNPQIPFPVTTHPRLWVTTGDLSRLQSWAKPSNPVYTAMTSLLATAVNNYQTQFFPGGQPNPNYPDPGDTQGYGQYLTEANGLVLAFNSLIDPSPAKRITYAQYTRNLLMYAMNQAALGPLANAPFRDPQFAIYNRANGQGEMWPLMVDWIYNAKDGQGNPILTAADKLTIRKVFMMWATACLNAETTGGDHPSPIGATNSNGMFPGGAAYRMASNNYFLGHARLLTMMSLSIDPSDDPPVNPAKSPALLGNTLRSYILNATGAWLYEEYAMMGEPSTVASDYYLPGKAAGFGLASGGLPPEGMLYGHSFGYVLGQLLALQTAGFNNPALAGPQIKLINAPVWDRYVTGFISSLTPKAQTFSSEPWLGSVYQFAGYGDLLRLYATPDTMVPFALLSTLEQEQGLATHLNAARWFAVNAVPGGAQGLADTISNPWTWSPTDSVLYYLLLDPSVSTTAATDPRPNFPTTFVDPGASRIVAHSDWGTNPTEFDYRSSWESINHQDGDAGEFQFFRNGEWLTKEMCNYDNNLVGSTTYFHNTLALKNWASAGTPNLNWNETGEWANGSQWILGSNAGDPVNLNSNGTGYVYASSDLTNLYNRPQVWQPQYAATDIKQATRSILWLKNDTIVVYDRATSIHSGLFKTFNLCLVNDPVINGNVATETMADGQKLYVQSLLPQNLTMTSVNAAGELNPIAELEPTKYVLSIQDPSLPTDTRFLTVLQGASTGTAMVQAQRVSSSSGTAFDGALFGTTAVYFPVSTATAVSTTQFAVPTNVALVYVTGLKPGASYGVNVESTSTGTTITVTPGGTGATADSAGLIKIAA